MTGPFARAWAASGVLFLTALFVGGVAMAQIQSTNPDEPASPLLRQGTIMEEDLTGSAPEPAPSVGQTVPETPAVTEPLARPEGQPNVPRPGPEKAEPEASRPATAVLAPQPAPAAPASDVRSDHGTGDSYPLPDLTAATGTALPQREASMKLLQQGRTLLRAESHDAALARFEQAIRVDSTNPYSHYFVARAHYFLGNYRESLNFLEVAESGLAVDDRWLAEVYVLRARNATALGFHARADLDYVRALRLQPFHGYSLARLTSVEPLARAGRNP